MGLGRDLDEAVLAATNRGLEANGGLVNMVSLTFKGINFPNLDTFTRTDAMVVLYKKEGQTWKKLGRSEVIMDNLSPEWVTSFDVAYQFERREFYRADIYHAEDFDNLENFAGHKLLGNLEFALHEVVTARNQTLEKDLIS